MGKLGYGYGSEFHLLRLLGRHRNWLDEKILNVLGYDDKEIEWLDYKFKPKQFIPDGEFIGIEFLESLPKFNDLKDLWKNYWPSNKNAQNWDAICKIDDEWILIEAKATENEIKSNSGASIDSLKKINNRFDIIKKKYGITSTNDWSKNYYQKANRLLFHEFLSANWIKAKLVFIYFINGYEKNGKQLGVATKAQWENIIKDQNSYLGISTNKFIKAKSVDLIIDIGK